MLGEIDLDPASHPIPQQWIDAKRFFTRDNNGLEKPRCGRRRARRRSMHSAKTDEAYAALEEMFGDVRRIDMFGRKPRPGWSVWGNGAVGKGLEERGLARVL